MTPFETNLLLQTTILAVVSVSMAFRMKGNFVINIITMAVAVVLGFTVAGMASPLFFDYNYTQTLMSPTMNLATFGTHAFFGIASFASGITLIAFLIRDRAVPGRSNLIAKTVTILWILALHSGDFASPNSTLKMSVNGTVTTFFMVQSTLFLSLMKVATISL